MRRYRPLWLISLPLLLSLACNFITGAGAPQPPTSTPAPADTLPPADTVAAAPTDTDTALPADTPVPPAVADTPGLVTGAQADTPTPAEDTGLLPTLAVPGTAPAAIGTDQATVVAAQATMAAALAELTTALPALGGTLVVPALTPGGDATQRALMGSMGNIQSISLYSNPVGTPVSSWHDVPVMSQATAGQEFSPVIYSYRANATLAQARDFYAAKAATLSKQPLTMGTGYGGTGSNAYHSANFISYSLTIVLTSQDNDPQHVLVVISIAP